MAMFDQSLTTPPLKSAFGNVSQGWARDSPADISPGPGCPADIQSQSRDAELENRGILRDFVSRGTALRD